jgi:hypothetical protein
MNYLRVNLDKYFCYLYPDPINDEVKTYLPYIIALMHSSKAVPLRGARRGSGVRGRPRWPGPQKAGGVASPTWAAGVVAMRQAAAAGWAAPAGTISIFQEPIHEI